MSREWTQPGQMWGDISDDEKYHAASSHPSSASRKRERRRSRENSYQFRQDSIDRQSLYSDHYPGVQETSDNSVRKLEFSETRSIMHCATCNSRVRLLCFLDDARDQLGVCSPCADRISPIIEEAKSKGQSQDSAARTIGNMVGMAFLSSYITLRVVAAFWNSVLVR